ncbi:HCNGP-domain-containing protein [Dentipellis sp. KUC8613]|nr:HCNGP-domain-containing protein [Dentipellis sp. KUC8613]
MHAEPRRSSAPLKSQLIIRRPAHQKPRARAHISDDINSVVDSSQLEASSSTASTHSHEPALSPREEPLEGGTPVNELTKIRELLQPPQIPGVVDWGIPPPSMEPCDPAVETKLAHFNSLKRDPTQPKHFNDSLMSNRSFRNPHLYAKLVEFVAVDERSTNFPKEVWDPDDVVDDWFAGRIAERQKARSEQQEASQSSAKRTKIDFTAPRQPSAAVSNQSGVSGSGRKSHFGSHITGSAPRSGDGAGRGKSRWG